jgi:hypothetical protein
MSSTLLQRVKATYKMSSNEIEIIVVESASPPEMEAQEPAPVVQAIETEAEGKEPEIEQPDEGEEEGYYDEDEYDCQDWYSQGGYEEDYYGDNGWGCDWNESGYFD